jgi:hypothetical protein
MRARPSRPARSTLSPPDRVPAHFQLRAPGAGALLARLGAAEQEAFTFNVLVQNGTLVAVVAYFWKDLLGIAVGVCARAGAAPAL